LTPTSSWDGTKWVTNTTVASGVWVGEQMWNGTQWVYAKAMNIDLGVCGSTVIQRALIPDAPLGFDFAICCTEHDACYGTKCAKKSTCDTNFHKCLSNQVKKYQQWFRPGFTGDIAAATFSLSVSCFGCPAYKQAQIIAGNTNPTCD